MRRTIIIGIILVPLLLISSTTAIPYVQSKPINLLRKHFDQSINQIPISISDLIGMFYLIAGIISLYLTGVMVMIAFVAIIFNPMGFLFFFAALFPAVLSYVFLNGGFDLLLNQNPINNFFTTLRLSNVFVIMWIILRLNNVTIRDILNLIYINIVDFIESLIPKNSLKERRMTTSF